MAKQSLPGGASMRSNHAQHVREDMAAGNHLCHMQNSNSHNNNNNNNNNNNPV
jgi:hypothetical protein